MESSNFELNSDILYAVLLKSDIDTIENLCLLDKRMTNFCNDKNFWHAKFELDNLPIILKDQLDNLPRNKNTLPWIYEYKDVYNAKRKSEGLINLGQYEYLKYHEKYNYNYPVTMTIRCDNDCLLFLPPDLRNNIINRKLTFNGGQYIEIRLLVKREGDEYHHDDISYYAYENEGDKIVSFRLERESTLDEIKALLFEIIYNSRDIDVIDDDNISYLTGEIITQGYQYNEDIPAIIEDRIEFWKQTI